jgi:hypothetical protein
VIKGILADHASQVARAVGPAVVRATADASASTAWLWRRRVEAVRRLEATRRAPAAECRCLTKEPIQITLDVARKNRPPSISASQVSQKPPLNLDTEALRNRTYPRRALRVVPTRLSKLLISVRGRSCDGLTLWLAVARKEAKPTEGRPVEPRVRSDHVRCRA